MSRTGTVPARVLTLVRVALEHSWRVDLHPPGERKTGVAFTASFDRGGRGTGLMGETIRVTWTLVKSRHPDIAADRWEIERAEQLGGVMPDGRGGTYAGGLRFLKLRDVAPTLRADQPPLKEAAR